MYDREYGERELKFEASGALWQATIVMRDRETDSWWSIITAKAISGEMEGADLKVLPYGEKATWSDWVERYPHTLVLSVDGREHNPVNYYDSYFVSEMTYENLEIADQRLEPKTPIFSFHHGGKTWAAPHAAFAGGRIFDLGEHGRIFLNREEGASLFASTHAFFVAEDFVAEDAGLTEGLEAIQGFDTFWYNWVAVNKGSEVLR